MIGGGDGKRVRLFLLFDSALSRLLDLTTVKIKVNFKRNRNM